MTRDASIKETGDQISDEKWRRFEAEVGMGTDRPSSDDMQTDQPYREEAEHTEKARYKPTDDAGTAKPDQGAGKKTQRTE